MEYLETDISALDIRRFQLIKNDKTCSFLNMFYVYLNFNFEIRGLCIYFQHIMKYI